MKHPCFPTLVRGLAAAIVLAALLLLLTVPAQAADTTPTIKPGALWPDDRGEHINAHGGGIIKLSDTWYWFGEYRPKDAVPGRRYVSCYSSSDLLLKVVGTQKTTVIFMGDQWKPKAQWDSRYLWMPVEIGDGRLWLPEPREWTLDVATGVATVR